MSPEIDFKDINKGAKCPGRKEWLMPELCPISLPLVLGTERAEASTTGMAKSCLEQELA